MKLKPKEGDNLRKQNAAHQDAVRTLNQYPLYCARQTEYAFGNEKVETEFLRP
jgi:hypothetical protein